MAVNPKNNVYPLAGIAFPFKVQGAGLPGAAFGMDVIKYALIVLLRTTKGQRVFNPTLGTSLQSLIFSVQGPALQSLITREILNAIANFLPQVVVTNLTYIETDDKIQVNVFYNIQGVQGQTGNVTVVKKG
jgi:phage baseplate assembly protein W